MMLDTYRLAAAGGITLGYLGLCALWLRTLWRKAPQPLEASEHWVVHASQTGHAETLATVTAAALDAAGETVRLLPLNRLDATALEACRKISFIVSTTGDGDVPDAGVRFVEQVMRQRLKLKALHYAVLALGNRDFTHYCAFGRGLDAWLAECGARPRFARIDVDDHDADALTAWHDALGLKEPGLNQPGVAPVAPAAPVWRDATLISQRHLNPGSAGEPVYSVALELPREADWQAGDVLDLQPPADSRDTTPRTYTLASLPSEYDGTPVAQLLVRAQRRSDGTPGRVSNWLCSGTQPGDTFRVQIRAQPGFRVDGNAGVPLLLVGSGTGLAGLVAHLKARAESGGPPCWLVYGERNAAHDDSYRDTFARWQATGVLDRVDAVFSRDGGAAHYVQDALRQHADRVRSHVKSGGAIYVCGSRVGMAEGVDAALADALGREPLDTLAIEGRYRRDVY